MHKLDDEIQRLNMVVPASWAKKVDDWRRKEPDLPNLSEAIRRLVEMGLEAEPEVEANLGLYTRLCIESSMWFDMKLSIQLQM